MFMTQVTLVAAEEQGAPNEVGEDERAEVADVGGGVDGRAAAVHAHVTGLERLERLDGTAERVAELQTHRDTTLTRQDALMTRPAPSSPLRLAVAALTDTRAALERR